jgi:hypothetical protein
MDWLTSPSTRAARGDKPAAAASPAAAGGGVVLIVTPAEGAGGPHGTKQRSSPLF